MSLPTALPAASAWNWLLAAAQEKTPAGPSTPGSQLLLFIALMAVMFWLVVLRPQKRERRDRQKKLDAIKKGDRVISIGGIHGKVSEVDQNAGVVTVEVAPKVAIKFSKSAIQTVESRGSEKIEGKAGEGEKKE